MSLVIFDLVHGVNNGNVSLGLKKGDAVIDGFAEWKNVDKIASDNRDFLRGLSAGHYFEVM